MYCVKWKKMISNNCKFCPSCGTKTDFFQNNQVNKVYHFEYSQLSEKKYNYRSGVFGFTVFQFLLCIIMLFISVFCIITMNSWSFITSRTSDIIRILCFLAIVYFATLVILKLLKLIAVKNTYLFVTNSGIQGVGGSPSYLGNVNVNVSYRDITMVTNKSGLLIVNTHSGNYKFLLENNQDAANDILSRMQYR